MKFIVIQILVLALISYSTNAQVKTVYIKTPGITCEDCQGYVEGRLGGLTGVMELEVNPYSKNIRVVYLTTRTSVENLRAQIAYLGFVADTVLPTDTRFTAMPQCCRASAKKSYELRLEENIKLRKTIIAPKNDPVLVKPEVKPNVPVKPVPVKPVPIKPVPVKSTPVKPSVIPKVSTPKNAQPIKKS